MSKGSSSGDGDRGRSDGPLESAFLDSVIENIPDMIFLKDARDLRFVLLNRAGEELLGYTRDELIGRNDYDFFPREEADFFTGKDREVLEGKMLVDVPEEPIHTRHRGTRILHTKKIPILDAQGEPVYLLGISEDITELKHLQGERRRREELERAKRESDLLARRVRRSEAALQNTLESIPDAILVVDADGKVVEANRAAVGLFEATTKAELLAPMDQVFAGIELSANEDRAPSWEAIRRKTAVGEAISCDGTLRRPGGESVAIHLRASPLERPERHHEAIVVIRDVTEQKRLESLRDEFLSIAAHELKTPLTTVKGYAELMRRWPAEELVRRGPKALAVIHRQVGRLNRLVQELLEVSRLRLGRLELHREHVDLADLVQQVVVEMQAASRDHDIVLAKLEPVQGAVDRDRIEQVLANLLSNALIFSPEGGEVQVSLEGRGDSAVVTVRDFGLGIPADRQSRVFERYFRAHGGTEYAMTAGLGMGLYISKQLVTRHGGEIGFESREGEGSTFFFTLPLEGGAAGTEE